MASSTKTIPIRHLHVWMAFLAACLAFIMRINMSVSIITMTRQRSFLNNTSNRQQVYLWNEAEKNRVLSSFFWGYPVLQIPSRGLAEKCGAKIILFVVMTVSAVLTIVTPWLSDFGYLFICGVRVLLGVVQGVLFPAITVLLSKWVPLDEHEKASAFTNSGIYVGAAVGFPLCGYLTSTEYGWPSIYYISGILGIVWSVVWICICTNTPREHNFISPTECIFVGSELRFRKNIESTPKNDDINDIIRVQGTGQIYLKIFDFDEMLMEWKAFDIVFLVRFAYGSREGDKLKSPWKKIVLSRPVWAVLISELGFNWGFFTFLTQMPNYMNSNLKIDVKKACLLLSVPYLCASLTNSYFLRISIKLGQTRIVSKIVERKIWNSIGLWGCAVCWFALSLSAITTDTTRVLVLFAVMITMYSAMYYGSLTNHTDLSPNFSDSLSAFTNSLSQINSIIAPLCTGWIVTDPTDETQWDRVFLICSIISFSDNLCYLIFGSSTVQVWNAIEGNQRKSKIINNKIKPHSSAITDQQK